MVLLICFARNTINTIKATLSMVKTHIDQKKNLLRSVNNLFFSNAVIFMGV